MQRFKKTFSVLLLAGVILITSGCEQVTQAFEDTFTGVSHEEKVESIDFRQDKEVLTRAQSELYELFGTKDLQLATHLFVNKDNIYAAIYHPVQTDEADLYYYTKQTMAWENNGPFKVDEMDIYKQTPFKVSELDFSVVADIYDKLQELISDFDEDTSRIDISAQKRVMKDPPLVFWAISVHTQRRDIDLTFDALGQLLSQED